MILKLKTFMKNFYDFNIKKSEDSTSIAQNKFEIKILQNLAKKQHPVSIFISFQLF